MAENPISAALSNLGRSIRGQQEYEIQAREQQLRGEEIAARERLALEGLRLTGQKEEAAANLASAQELNAQRQYQQNFAQRQLEFEQQQEIREGQLQVQRNQLREEVRNNKYLNKLKDRELDQLGALRKATARYQNAQATGEEYQNELYNTKVSWQLGLGLLAAGGSEKDARQLASLGDALKQAGIINEENGRDMIQLGKAGAVVKQLREMRNQLGLGNPVTREERTKLILGLARSMDFFDPSQIGKLSTIVDDMLNDPEGFKVRTQVNSSIGDVMQEMLDSLGKTPEQLKPEELKTLRDEATRVGTARAYRILGMEAPAAPPPAPAPTGGGPGALGGVGRIAGRAEQALATQQEMRQVAQQLRTATSSDPRLGEQIIGMLRSAQRQVGRRLAGGKEAAINILRQIGLSEGVATRIVETNGIEELIAQFERSGGRAGLHRGAIIGVR